MNKKVSRVIAILLSLALVFGDGSIATMAAEVNTSVNKGITYDGSDVVENTITAEITTQNQGVSENNTPAPSSNEVVVTPDKAGMYTPGWQVVAGKTVYIKPDGSMANGLYVVDGKGYIFKDTVSDLEDIYEMQIGYVEYDERWYFAKSNGVLQTGFQKINDVWKYFATPEDAINYNKDIVAEDDKVTDYSEITVTADGNWVTRTDTKNVYYFKDNKTLLSGWQTIDSKKYAFTKEGYARKGFATVSGKNYYFFEKASGDNRVGARAVGTFTIRDPKTAQMSDVDYAAYVAGLTDNGIYAGDKGTRTYYANTSGVITSGWNKIDGNWRYFEYGKKSDYCVEKKVTKNGDFYTLGADSNTDDLQDSYKEIAKVARIYYITTAIQKGWQTLGIHKYYIKSNGIVSTGVTKTSGKYYCFDNTGKMQTYQFAYNGKTYLADKSGILKTGWQKISDNWYYYNTNTSDLTVYGSRADGIVDVDYWAYVDNGDGSDAYYLDKGTTLITGFKTISLQNYFFDVSGKLQKSGFFKEGDYTYFAKPGKTKKGNSDKVGSLVKGYVKNLDTTGDGTGDGKNYFFNEKFQMQFGWQYISEITLDSEVGYNGAWHFFDTKTGEELTWTDGVSTLDGGRLYVISAAGSPHDIGTYYIKKGEVVRGGFKTVVISPYSYLYYFDKYGKMMTGLKTINKSNYCFKADGKLQRGLVKFDASENVLQSGDAPHHMRFYDLKTGVQRYGWQLNGTKKYYIFGSSSANVGLVATGFQTISTKTYYFDPLTGVVMTSKFFEVGGKWYYASASGILYKGYKKIGTGFYLFDSTTGELLSDKDAPAKTGWTIQDGSKYYILNGSLATGLTKIGSKTYYFNKLGQMQTGFVKTSTSSYYFNANGEMVTGLTTLGAPYNGTFYFATDGKMQTGFKRIRVADVPTTMFFDAKGVRQTIQPLALQLDGSFANDTPAVITWVEVGDDIYYLTKQVTPVKGFQTIAGKKFYFNSAGILQTGSTSISKAPYLFDANGNPITGWVNDGGTYYYAGSTGKLATGLKKIKGADSVTRSYLFDSTGELQVGKFEYNKAIYISSSTGTLGQELGSLLTGYVSYNNGGTIEKYYLSPINFKMGRGWKKVDVNGIITWRFFDYVTGIENQALAGDTKGSDISTALNPITTSDQSDSLGTVKIKANDVVSLSEIVSVKAKIYNEDAGSLTAKTYQFTKVGVTDDYTLDFDIANHKYAQGNYNITLVITDAKNNVRKLKSNFIMKCNYNDVALSVTPNENQSKLDLKVVNGRFSSDYKAIKVLVTAPGGSNKYYTLKNKGMGVYEGVADLKDFGYLVGTYTGKLYAQTIDQDGAMAIKVGASYITDTADIAGVDAGSLIMDSKDDVQGTFLVEVSGNNAVASIVDAYVTVNNVYTEANAPVYKKFQMLKNEEGNYYANIDTGYFGYIDGDYDVTATLVDERGLKSTTQRLACNDIRHSLADLKLVPKRNAQQSGFLFTVDNARFNKNVKAVKAKVDIVPDVAVLNSVAGSNLVEYTLSKTGNKTYYGNVNIKNHGYKVDCYYRVRLYVQTASGAQAKMKEAGGVTEAADESLVYVKTAYYKVDNNGAVTQDTIAGRERSAVWIDGLNVGEVYGKVVAIDKDKGRNTVVVGGTILTPADVAKVEMTAYPSTVNSTSNLAYTYKMERQKDGTYKAVIDILNHELSLGDYKVIVKVTDTRGVVTEYKDVDNLDGAGNYFLITKLTASAEYLAGLATTKGVGIDVSKHQGAINWAQVATNDKTNTTEYKHKIRFAMIRSSYTGRDTLKLVTDEKYATNVAGAKAAGIKTGVYHYSCAADVNKAKEEANYSIAVVNKAGGGIALPIAFDIEEATRRSVNSKQTNTDMVIAFAQQVKAAGYKTMVYADKDMFVNYLDETRIRAAGIDFWVAQWNKTGQTAVKDCQIWQTTDKGTVSGISGSVDMNVCYKEYK